ncbi:helix-turn-helix transcriptional regulator [Stenotrophomonas sp. B1-1]|uniref:helix-turn-helix domain-containing protein n=1 Tax=Stenotrophomonas sp. B1-1 TaxID=2710648 RepID=UPI0013DAB446|nr:helix-turn-helix transcriptional regulator [Stenotrophomonas sp. B1-1]
MEPKSTIGDSASHVGQRLKAERKRLGLSQTQIAEPFGMQRQTIQRYEAGKSSPTTEYLLAVEQLGINAGYVLTGRVEQMQALEQLLIARFRGATTDTQRAVLSVLGIGDNSALQSSAVPGIQIYGGNVTHAQAGQTIHQDHMRIEVGSRRKRSKPSK